MWSAPVASWCAGRDIVHGVGDGSFRPGDPLTGQQFAKMLLCALGLGDPGRYVNGGWDTRVKADADALGLLNGDGDMCTAQPISRQQAALMANNAYQAAETSQPAGGSSGRSSSSPQTPDEPDETSSGTPATGPANTENPPEQRDENETSMMTDF